jgi:hypothetical protein
MKPTGKKIKKELTDDVGKLVGWNMAISRAQQHLQRNKVQAAKLRAAIRLFKQKLSAGEPWPGGKILGQKG